MPLTSKRPRPGEWGQLDEFEKLLSLTARTIERAREVSERLRQSMDQLHETLAGSPLIAGKGPGSNKS